MIFRRRALPEVYKQKLLNKKDRRISPGGVVIIKSQSARTQEANREKALARLKEPIKEAMQVRKSRRATTPTWGSKENAYRLKEHAQKRRT